MELIEELKSVYASSTCLLSQYIPFDSNVNEIKSNLESELSKTSKIKAKETMKNVQSTLKRAIAFLKGNKVFP